jgi:hypothetical protein
VACRLEVTGAIERSYECAAVISDANMQYLQIAIPIGQSTRDLFSCQMKGLVMPFEGTYSDEDTSPTVTYASASLKLITSEIWSLLYYADDSQRPAIVQEAGSFTLTFARVESALSVGTGSSGWILRDGSFEADLEPIEQSDASGVVHVRATF